MATMDGKSLFSTGKQIQKAVESGDTGESLLNILQPLTKWTATEDLLRQSKIGVIVSKLRQQKDPKVAEQASKLVQKWKQDVNASKKKAAGSSSPAPSGAAAKANAATNGKSSGTSSPAPPAVKKETKKSTVDPAKRNSVTDNISTAVTGNQTRDACVKLMYDGLAFMSEEGVSHRRPRAGGVTVNSKLTQNRSRGCHEGRPQRRTCSLQRFPARNVHYVQAEDAIALPEP